MYGCGVGVGVYGWVEVCMYGCVCGGGGVDVGV